MSDDRLDEFIDRAAAEYNQPPSSVPRDEMWARIQRERARERTEVKVIPLHRRARWVAVVAAIAAALVVGWLGGRGSASGPDTLADNRPSQPATGIERKSSDSTVAPVTVPDAPGLASAEPQRSPTTRRGPTRDAPVDRASDMSYEVATINHLAQMEALLTTFRAETRNGEMDAQISTWARDLLTTTRLLLDSPAAEETKNRRLFEDLELVLVQIVNLAPDARASDRGSIERTLENGQVMTRLRTAVPAGGLPRGT